MGLYGQTLLLFPKRGLCIPHSFLLTGFFSCIEVHFVAVFFLYKLLRFITIWKNLILSLAQHSA